ncbi:putative Thioredoxin [Trypanosoma vivax]|nr:putative Thioredoxin [Trypanosoma vivax]
MGEVYQEFGKDSGLAIKLGLVDCVRNATLTQQFNVEPQMFPIVYFVRNKVYADKMVGIVPEAQIKEAIDALLNMLLKR